MISLGIEGTAHTLGVGIVDSDGRILADVKKVYTPKDGGIHPREASRYIAENFGDAVREALAKASLEKTDIDVVSFSQGPGLGPCLSNIAVGARVLALCLNKPLVGVNHCVAHIEIGNLQARKEFSEWGQPLVLYVSGGNTQLLMLKKGRYRVFGETLDIGIGNMLDKFGRLVGMQHPAGPKIEELAKHGEHYLRLPYVVKGNDLSFSGILTESVKMAHKEPLEDVCFSLQETTFAMLTEAAERALCHLKSNCLLLTGGVANNKRLREMFSIMAEDNSALFSVPDGYCSDNGAMIAWTGLIMYKNGFRQNIEDTQVNQSFRTDDVEIIWAEEREATGNKPAGRWKGAEALLVKEGSIVKKMRMEKKYRLPELDVAIRRARTAREPNLLRRASSAGVKTPKIVEVFKDKFEIDMEFIPGPTVSQYLDLRPSEATTIGAKIGESVTKLHQNDIIHGDLTTSNMVLCGAREDVASSAIVCGSSTTEFAIAFIDFGLGDVSSRFEDKATDLLLLKKAINANHSSIGDELWGAIFSAYGPANKKEIAQRLHAAERRGRYLC